MVSNSELTDSVPTVAGECSPVGKDRAGQGLGAGVVTNGHAHSLARQRELLGT